MLHQESRQQLDNLMHNIAVLRRRNGLSRSRMAALLKISLKSLDRIERGEMPSKLSANVILLAMVQFNMTSDDLLKQRLEE